MIPVVEVAGARVFLGDCREVLKHLPDNSVDSVVTDPPYELGFMGKKWDSSGVAYDVTVWQECLRVLKPGGHILAFGGSRTWHRLAVAVEDAGFELRDSIAWLYGSGFPKSLDVSKAIDKKAGAEREVVGYNQKINVYSDRHAFGESQVGEPYGKSPITSAATSEAKAWEGWGTALKPAFEPVVVGRKPLVGTVAENVLEWGVGGLNIDGSRIGTQGGTKIAEQDIEASRESKSVNAYGNGIQGPFGKPVEGLGRWPANVILDEVSAGLLDEQSGVSKSPAPYVQASKNVGIYGAEKHHDRPSTHHGDSGGASRFFYVAKASKRDRNEGLEDLEAVRHADRTKDDGAGGENPRNRTNQARQNFHPTVKPTQLMRYLIKLVTPAGGVVLDPFTGSGSTGKAALVDGFQFVGAELTEEYLPIIEGRLRWASEQEAETDDTLF